MFSKGRKSQKNDVIYIAGKIGETTDYIERFKAIEDFLRNDLTFKGVILNPVTICYQCGLRADKNTWDEFMKVCLSYLSNATHIVMCVGWETSKGAMEEYKKALKMKIPILFEEDLRKEKIY